jgi:hypothetical protein
MPTFLRTFNPETGTLLLRADEPTPGSAAASLMVCGDWGPESGPVRDMRLDRLLPRLRQADLAVINVEVVLSAAGVPGLTKDGILQCRPPEAARRLSDVLFHVACLANNHVMDLGRPGLESTLRLLEIHGLQTVSAGLSAEQAERGLMCRVGDSSVAVINVAVGEEARSVDGGAGAASLDLQRLQIQIGTLRRQGALIVVVVHAGREYLPVPAPHIRRLFHALADAGAGLVIGHHPHVPQGLEVVGDTPIAHSLGNFDLFDESGSALRRQGYALKATLKAGEVLSVGPIPYCIERQGPVLLEGEERRAFHHQFEGLSRLAEDASAVDAIWDAYVDRWLPSSGLSGISDSLALIGGSRWLLPSALMHGLGLDRQPAGRSHLVRSPGWKLAGALRPGELKRDAASRQGAAVLRNRFETLSHREVYLLALQRQMDGRVGQAPAWARDLPDEWQIQ